MGLIPRDKPHEAFIGGSASTCPPSLFRHSPLVLLSADRLLVLLCSVTVCLLFLCSHPVAPHVSVQPLAWTGSCVTVTRTLFLISLSDGKTWLRLKLQCAAFSCPIRTLVHIIVSFTIICSVYQFEILIS